MFHADLYEVRVLTAYNQVDLLVQQARHFMPDVVVIANEEKYERVKNALSDLPIKVYAGAESLCEVVEMDTVDMVLTAMVGYAGLRPTIHDEISFLGMSDLIEKMMSRAVFIKQPTYEDYVATDSEVRCMIIWAYGIL